MVRTMRGDMLQGQLQIAAVYVHYSWYSFLFLIFCFVMPDPLFPVRFAVFVLVSRVLQCTFSSSC